MIEEIVVYKCICDKCGHGKEKDWITKSAKIPKVCSRCKSTKWNGELQASIVKDFAKLDARILSTKPIISPAAIYSTPALGTTLTCSDCGDGCASLNSFKRCEACQKEFEYDEARKGKE